MLDLTRYRKSLKSIEVAGGRTRTSSAAERPQRIPLSGPSNLPKIHMYIHEVNLCEDIYRRMLVYNKTIIQNTIFVTHLFQIH